MLLKSKTRTVKLNMAEFNGVEVVDATHVRVVQPERMKLQGQAWLTDLPRPDMWSEATVGEEEATKVRDEGGGVLGMLDEEDISISGRERGPVPHKVTHARREIVQVVATRLRSPRFF